MIQSIRSRAFAKEDTVQQADRTVAGVWVQRVINAQPDVPLQV